jgi:hypothetical protein
MGGESVFLDLAVASLILRQPCDMAQRYAGHKCSWGQVQSTPTIDWASEQGKRVDGPGWQND